ncbi:MAG: FG-GAP repeat protein [Chthoniobacterales bacterium]|jgi:hypothetical protein|nr:FG-GAP repeat protein [Chthoniobacterales bacterium]
MSSKVTTYLGAILVLTIATSSPGARLPASIRANSTPQGADSRARAGQITLVAAARKAGASELSAQALADAVTKKVYPRDTLVPPSVESANEYFGYSVAISGRRAPLSGCRGAIFISSMEMGALSPSFSMARVGNLEAELTPSDRTGLYDNFGLAVALQGNRAVVGADGTDEQEGAAYIYDFNGTTWVQTARLQPKDGSFGDGDLFGNAVALDGDRVLIGRVFDSEQYTNNGAAFTFTYNGTAWTQEARLDTTTFGYIFRNLGVSVALSGNRALLGSVSGEDFTGRAFVFVFDASSWTLEATLDATDFFASSGFGGSIALQGTTALVGGNDLIGNTSAIAVGYVFQDDGNAWNLAAKLSPAEGGIGLAGVAFEGPAVALDGSRALLGGVNLLGTSNPRTYLFSFDGTSWTEKAKFIRTNHGANQSGDDFGHAVALDRGRAVVGAPYFEQNQIFAGTAYIYSLPRAQ